ncbi:hypothetical protein KBB08_04060 [Candidatus Gracilibacteria bacterium]|nr:hypothetical protein [Candidatus Gracilibacteria bacterium]
MHPVDHHNPEQQPIEVEISDVDLFVEEWGKFATIFCNNSLESFEDPLAQQEARYAKECLHNWQNYLKTTLPDPIIVLNKFGILRQAITNWKRKIDTIISDSENEISHLLSALIILLQQNPKAAQYRDTIQVLQEQVPPYTHIESVLRASRQLLSPAIYQLGQENKDARNKLVDTLRKVIERPSPKQNHVDIILTLLDGGHQRVTSAYKTKKQERDVERKRQAEQSVRQAEIAHISETIMVYKVTNRHPDESVTLENLTSGVYRITYSLKGENNKIVKQIQETFYGEGISGKMANYRTFKQLKIQSKFIALRRHHAQKAEHIVVPARDSQRPPKPFIADTTSQPESPHPPLDKWSTVQACRNNISSIFYRVTSSIKKGGAAILNTPVPKSLFFWNTPIAKKSLFWNRPIPKSFNRSTFLRVLAALALVGVMKNAEEKFQTHHTNHTTTSTSHQQRQTTTARHTTTTTTHETTTVNSTTVFDTRPTLPAPTTAPETMVNLAPEVTPSTTATLATTPEGVVLGSASVSHGSRYASTSLQHNTDETLQRIIGTLGYNSVQTKVIATRLDQQLLTARNLVGPHLHTQKTDNVVVRSQMSNGHEQIQVQVTDPSGHIRYQTDWFDREVGFRNFIPAR